MYPQERLRQSNEYAPNPIRVKVFFDDHQMIVDHSYSPNYIRRAKFPPRPLSIHPWRRPVRLRLMPPSIGKNLARVDIIIRRKSVPHPAASPPYPPP